MNEKRILIRRLLVLFSLFALTACSAKTGPMQPGHAYPPTRYGNLCQLYDELQNFKNNPQFHGQGFADDSPYKPWFDRLQSMAGEESGPVQARDAARAMSMLGLAYRQQKGRESPLTEALNKQIRSLLNQLETEEKKEPAAP
jgi:hypothetical protein